MNDLDHSYRVECICRVEHFSSFFSLFVSWNRLHSIVVFVESIAKYL